MLLINPAEQSIDMLKFHRYLNAFNTAYKSLLKCLKEPSYKDKLFRIKTSFLTIDPLQFDLNLKCKDDIPILDHI